MTEDFASDETADPRLPGRVNTAVGTVLGLAVALLIAMLPGGIASGARSQMLGAGAADQLVQAAANRLGETRSSFHKTRGPARGFDFDDTPLLPAAIAALILIASAAASLRPAPVRAQHPARRPSTTRARAPPRA